MSLFNATVFAIEYAQPLIAFSRLAVGFVHDGVTNKLIKGLELSTPNSTLVVSPNVDTLYSTAQLDLADTNLVLTVPAPEDRYWGFAFYDPFGGVFANIGSIEQQPPGDYLIRRAVDAGVKPGLHVFGNHSHHHHYAAYTGIVNSPVTNPILQGRVLVKNNYTDLPLAQQAVNASNLVTVERTGPNKLPVPPLSLDGTFGGITNITTNTTQQLLFLSRLNEGNPPYNISHHGKVTHELKKAGVGNGTYTVPHGVNLTQANATAAAAILEGRATVFQPLGNGWVRNVPQATYGSNYIGRDIVAAFGYLENTLEQVLYPALTNNEASLADNESYIYTFSGKPPLKGNGNGFWSVTMYSLSHFLVANPENKYEVGDRSNITYPDGTLVYSNDTDDTQKPFQVLIQSLNNPPPHNWTANWLPAPANFTILLRFYAPEPAIYNGSYVYPTITKGAAIVA